MNEIIGQVLGVIVTIIAIIVLQLKKRNQILWMSILVNIIGGLNVFFLESFQFTSGIIVNVVAVLQIIVALIHEKRATRAEIIPASCAIIPAFLRYAW